MNFCDKLKLLASESDKSPIMRPHEHDACIAKLDSTALTKLHNHHLEMSKLHKPEHGHGGDENLHRHNAKLADAYRTILMSVRNQGNIR
jgi:hypothetical protein